MLGASVGLGWFVEAILFTLFDKQGGLLSSISLFGNDKALLVKGATDPIFN